MAALSMCSAQLQGYRGTVSSLLGNCVDRMNECYAAGDDTAAALVADAIRALDEAHDRLKEAAAYCSGR